MEDRLIELETRYMQQQQTLQDLSDVLVAQEKAVARLEAEVAWLKRKLEALGDPGIVDAARDEKPPHY